MQLIKALFFFKISFIATFFPFWTVFAFNFFNIFLSFYNYFFAPTAGFLLPLLVKFLFYFI